MELSHFTDSDWLCFMGCTTERPLLGSWRSRTVVVDGIWVEVHESGEHVCSFQFPDVGCAVAFALELEGSEPIHIMEMKADRLGQQLL